jgi:hypothetical protein
MGPPQDSDDYYHKYSVRNYKYSLEQEEVYISFSSWGSASECATRLPIGTVLEISITPKTELHLSYLKLDESKLIKFDPSTPPNIGYEGYIDEEEGIVIRTFKGKIDKINYIPSAADRQFCPDSYKNLKESISILVDFLDRDRVKPSGREKEESGKHRNKRKP